MRMKKLLSLVAVAALVMLPSCCCKKKTSSKDSSSRSYGKKMVKKLACGCPVGKCMCGLKK
jgi:ABC-type phosphate/phosphonate transport system substrate-binding protein